jgi:hypothetical protein
MLWKGTYGETMIKMYSPLLANTSILPESQLVHCVRCLSPTAWILAFANVSEKNHKALLPSLCLITVTEKS